MKETERQLVFLAEHGIEFVVVGGVAATLHGSSYVTHDLDVCYSRDGANLERLARALKSVARHHATRPGTVRFENCSCGLGNNIPTLVGFTGAGFVSLASTLL